MSISLPPGVLLRCFLHSYVVYAAYNSRGLQNIGFMYSIDPGLKAIHASPENLLAARDRYIRHHNCHPFWTPLLLGVFLRTEADIAAGRLDPATFTDIKDVVVNSLSALGDSVFGGSLLVTWALACALLAALGHPAAGLCLSIVLFAALQAFKLASFGIGLSHGLAILLWLGKIGLINWGDMLKLFNALLLCLFLVQILHPESRPGLWISALAAIVLAAWLTNRVHLPRLVMVFSAFVLAVAI